jgi:hypothetical protein
MRNTLLSYIFKYTPGGVKIFCPERIFDHAVWFQEIYYQTTGIDYLLYI